MNKKMENKQEEKNSVDRIEDTIKNILWGPQTKVMTKGLLLGVALGSAGILNNKLRG